MLSIGTVVLLLIGPFVLGSPNYRGPDDEIQARSLSGVFQFNKMFVDTFYKVNDLINNFLWCGMPNCPHYPGKVDPTSTHPTITSDTQESGKTGNPTDVTKPESKTEPTPGKTKPDAKPSAPPTTPATPTALPTAPATH